MSDNIITKHDGAQVKVKNEVDFDFKGLNLPAMVDENGEFWFLAKDVGKILGVRSYREPVRTIVKDFEKGVRSSDTLGGKQDMIFISEPGLYRWVMRAQTRKQFVAEFQDWVLHEVLPSIRKYGIYILEERLKELEPKDLVELLSEMNPDADVIEDGGDLLICAKDIKSNLGYKSTNAITYRLREGTHFKKFNRIIYINNSGLKIVVERSRKSEAANIAKLANLNVVKEVPEATVVGEVIQTFGRKFKIDDQKPFHFEGKTCKVDLFFPELNLAFEVDEENHKDRDSDYEKRRQEHMEKTLGWKVIRVNPHDKMFTTGYACGLIFDFIFDYMKKVNKNPLKHITK